MTTNVPRPTFSPNGYVAPLEGDVLTGVQEDFQAAFGGILNFTTNADAPTNPTPQAQLADALTSIIALNNELFLLYCSLVDPALTYGRMQDAIGRIYYLNRIAGQATVISTTVIGIATTVVPEGSLVQDESGQDWASVADVTIPVGGSASANFACTALGPVTCPGDPLTIVSSITGWDSVNFVSQALGRDVETSQEFELRRGQSTAANSMGSLPSVTGAVRSVTGVLDARVLSNDAGFTRYIQGVPVLPYSVYVVVLGGLASSVAKAIWTKKMPGAVYNGSQIVQVQDTQSGQAPPYPTYTVKFDYALELPFAMRINVADLPSIPSNYVALIKTAIQNAFIGRDIVGYNSQGQPIYGARLFIGSTVFASRFYDTIKLLWAGALVVSIRLASQGSPDATFTGSIASTTLTVTSVIDGSLAPGQALFDYVGATVDSGTTIVGQLSGPTGGVGTYQVSHSQTVSSTDMVGCAIAEEEVPIDLNQVPVVNSADIYVNLVSPSGEFSS